MGCKLCWHIPGVQPRGKVRCSWLEFIPPGEELRDQQFSRFIWVNSAFYHKEFRPHPSLVLNWISFTDSAGASRLTAAHLVI